MSVKITRQDVPIRVLASGAQLAFPVFYVEGEPGPKVYIQANIHGPEIAGIGAIYDLLHFLESQDTLRGTLVIVPSVNPVALDSKINGLQVGYADLNETEVGNFNRIYKMLVEDSAEEDPHEDSPRKVALDAFVQAHIDSDIPTIKTAFRAALKSALDDMAAKNAIYGVNHGRKLAHIIQSMAYDADYLLDLHTAGDALYHLFTFAECQHTAPYLGLHYIIQLDESFSGVLDEAFLQPWLRLCKAFKKAGRDIAFEEFSLEAFTPEFGSADKLYRDAMQADAQRIINYLRYRGVLDGEATRYDGEYITCKHDDYRNYKAPTGGLLVWRKNLGDTLTKGERFATIIRPYAVGRDDVTEVDVCAVADGVMINRTETHVVHEGMGLCSVMMRVSAL